ncbi:MAG: M23 family metallopeptidase, partial [Gemmatimonadota bacterium]
ASGPGTGIASAPGTGIASGPGELGGSGLDALGAWGPGGARAAPRPERISLQLDADRTLSLFPLPDGRWKARLDSVPVVGDTILLAGTVTSNLYDAELSGDVDRLAPGERNEVVYALSQVFAWQIDFYRDIRTGDSYRVAIAREVRPDGTVRSARVLAAEFDNAGKTLSAIRFRPRPDGPIEYFDREGQALRSQFLRAPLDFGRVTSRFSYRRYHPILHRRRPHLGTDYGARPGTPVRATGDGVVTRAGRWGGYGIMVEIRHINRLRTRYAHLRGLARGIRRGVRVAQGQTIGYVGSTGLATAPHLHYEFLRDGRQVNAARLNLPRADPVSPELLPRFRLERDAAVALFGRLAGSADRMAKGAGTRRGRRTDD